MPFFQFKDIKISAVATAVPTRVRKVEEFNEAFGEDHVRHFTESTGVEQFRQTAEHQTASDLCYAAAEKIIAEKGIDRSTVGALVFVAHSTDYRRPATACVLHKRLGLDKDCVAYDISLGCSAFVYGMNVICSMMQSSDIQRGLLLVGETLTKMVNEKDQSVRMLFGDGGSAVLFEKQEGAAPINGILKSDGKGYKAIIAPCGGFRNMNGPKDDFVWPDGNVRSLYNTIMQGEDVFGFTISDVPRTIKEFFAKTETTADDYDCLAFHQANKFISQMLCKKIKADFSKMPICLDRYGNPSAPAVPLVMCDAYGPDNENKELNFLMCGFGVGLSWGVCAARVNVKDIYPIIETDEIFEEGIINSPEEFYEKGK